MPGQKLSGKNIFPQNSFGILSTNPFIFAIQSITNDDVQSQTKPHIGIESGPQCFEISPIFLLIPRVEDKKPHKLLTFHFYHTP
jgi:hypothetical protein